MSKIRLYTGHDSEAQGARSNGVTEFMLSSRLVEYINHPDIVVVKDDLPLKQTVQDCNRHPECLLAVELHFNAGGNPNTEGCETLYCPGSRKGKAAAEAFQKAFIGHEALHSDVRVVDRGAKEGWYRMEVGGTVDYFLRKTRPVALILEPEFIQQATHWYDIPEVLMEVADSIQAGLLAALKAVEEQQ